MKIQLKNLKINKQLSEETTCFSANLYVDGKKIAEVGNRGCGGPNEYHLTLDRNAFQKFEEFCRAQPALESEYGPLSMDTDLYIGGLVEEHELRQLCKKNVVFHVKGEHVQRILSGPYDEEAKKIIKNQFGDQVDVIFNERFLT